MIKAAGRTGAGSPLVLLGLSGENITRLVAGEPIRITAADMQALGLPPVEIVLHFGKTESAILAELRQFGVSVHGA